MNLVSPVAVEHLAEDWTVAGLEAAQPEHGMTPRHHEHLAEVVKAISTEIRRKYVAGNREHGGFLLDKTGILRHAIDEAADLCVYLLTAEEKERRVMRLLAKAWSERDWQSVSAAIYEMTGQHLDP